MDKQLIIRVLLTIVLMVFTLPLASRVPPWGIIVLFILDAFIIIVFGRVLYRLLD